MSASLRRPFCALSLQAGLWHLWSLWDQSIRYSKRFQPRIHGAGFRPHRLRSFPSPRDDRHTRPSPPHWAVSSCDAHLARAPPPHWEVCASLSGPSLKSSTDDFAPHFERQQAAMCGLHPLNHTVGCSMFTPSDLDAAVRRIVDNSQACALQVGAESEETATNHSGPGGWYSEQVLADALRVRGEHVLDQVPLGAQAGGVGVVGQDDVVGALVHLPGHWAALRRAGSQLWFIDSFAEGPILLATADDRPFKQRREHTLPYFSCAPRCGAAGGATWKHASD